MIQASLTAIGSSLPHSPRYRSCRKGLTAARIRIKRSVYMNLNRRSTARVCIEASALCARQHHVGSVRYTTVLFGDERGGGIIQGNRPYPSNKRGTDERTVSALVIQAKEARQNRSTEASVHRDGSPQ
eukprot:jgi/Ulvmu1/3564/UM166_0018.1